MNVKNPSGRPDRFRGARGPERSEMRKAAEAAGLSRHQMYQALAVASIPTDEFEPMVESDDPPTVTELARYGRSKPPRGPSSPLDRLKAAWSQASPEERAAFLGRIGAG